MALGQRFNEAILGELAVLVVLVGGTAALDYPCYAIAVAVPAPGDPHPSPGIRAADLAMRADT